MDPRLVRVVLAATPVLLMTIWTRPAPPRALGPVPGGRRCELREKIRLRPEGCRSRPFT